MTQKQICKYKKTVKFGTLQFSVTSHNTHFVICKRAKKKSCQQKKDNKSNFFSFCNSDVNFIGNKHDSFVI